MKKEPTNGKGPGSPGPTGAAISPPLGRLIDALATQDAKEYLADMTTNRESSKKPGPRFTKTPRKVGPAWALSDAEKKRFDSAYGVSKLVEPFLGKVHQDDRPMLYNTFAATLCFHELSKLIDGMEWEEGLEDVQSDLKEIRVGFELALQSLDIALEDRAQGLEGPRNLAIKKWENDARTPAQKEIKAEYDRWCAGAVQYDSAKHFAICMHAKHASTYKNERSIEGLVGKWGGNPRNQNAAE